MAVGASVPSKSSLRAKRSNPESLRGKILDCFAALAMTEDAGKRLTSAIVAEVVSALTLHLLPEGRKSPPLFLLLRSGCRLARRCGVLCGGEALLESALALDAAWLLDCGRLARLQ